MLPLGTKLPKFELQIVPDTGLSDPSLDRGITSFSSEVIPHKPLLLMFICAHCPFVKHVESELTNLDVDFGDQIKILAIASNSLESHPQDGPEFLAKQAKASGWSFPYLLDLDQSLAKSLKAACTPDFFLFSPLKDGGQRLCYRGQLDDSRPGNTVPVTGQDLRSALNAVLSGKLPSQDQKPSIGCNIKWKRGYEPSWVV